MSYTKLLRVLDGGYVKTVEGQLKFYFEEEYKIDASKFIEYRIYNSNRLLMAGVDLNGNVLGSANSLMKLSYAFDDNKRILPVNTISLVVGEYYILEVTTTTGEKLYLRFLYNGNN
jgi:hypothetical protein